MAPPARCYGRVSYSLPTLTLLHGAKFETFRLFNNTFPVYSHILARFPIKTGDTPELTIS